MDNTQQGGRFMCSDIWAEKVTGGKEVSDCVALRGREGKLPMCSPQAAHMERGKEQGGNQEKREQKIEIQQL